MARTRKVWDPTKGEITKPEPETAAEETAEKFAEDVIAAGETTDPEEMRAAADAFAEPEKTDEPAPGPLSDLQAALRDLLDYDQIAEVRLALSSRTEEIEKHLKKAGQLGIREEDARRRLRLIEGSETRFGLLRIFAPEERTEQRDVFFDRESPNGRPSADPEHDDTITFRTVDGLDITALRDNLDADDVLPHLQALHTAGTMPEHVKRAIDDADIAHLFEAFEVGEPAGVGA